MQATIFRPNNEGLGELIVSLSLNSHDVEAEIRRFYGLDDEQAIEPIQVLSTEGFTFDSITKNSDFSNLLAWTRLEILEDDRDLQLALAYYTSGHNGLPDADDYKAILDEAIEKHVFTGLNNPDVYSYEVCSLIGPFGNLDKQDWQFLNTLDWFDFQENSGYLSVSNPNNGRTVWIFRN